MKKLELFIIKKITGKTNPSMITAILAEGLLAEGLLAEVSSLFVKVTFKIA